MQVTVYVTAEKHEFKIDKQDRQEGLQEALQQAKDGKEVSDPQRLPIIWRSWTTRNT